MTGFATLAETRDHLLQYGMSDHLAEKLMIRYLRKIKETCNIYSLIDCFDKREAKAELNKAKTREIFTNYVNTHHIKT